MAFGVFYKLKLGAGLAGTDIGSGVIELSATGTSGIPVTIIDAKGDLVAGTANDTAARLPVGSNGQVLTADSTASTGVKWATASATSDPAADTKVWMPLFDSDGSLVLDGDGGLIPTLIPI